MGAVRSLFPFAFRGWGTSPNRVSCGSDDSKSLLGLSGSALGCLRLEGPAPLREPFKMEGQQSGCWWMKTEDMLPKSMCKKPHPQSGHYKRGPLGGDESQMRSGGQGGDSDQVKETKTPEPTLHHGRAAHKGQGRAGWPLHL
jgi:hypothetical protein